jgi:hypothetical protein
MLAGKHWEEAGMATLLDALVVLIEKGPGRTEIALAEAVGNRNRSLEDQVSAECQRLIDQRRVERRGTGSAFDPYRYYPR